MAVAYKVAGNRTYHSGNPTPGGQSTKYLMNHWWINGCWPRYTVNNQSNVWLTFWGRDALTAWMVAQRMEAEVVIHDRRILWK